MMKHLIITALLLLTATAGVWGQTPVPQHKPYIDLRPLHFGIQIGLHMQDIELQNVGPQLITAPDGTQQLRSIVTDADAWNPGFSVGVSADLRLNNHFSLRAMPTMHFGEKHLVFLDLLNTDENGRPARSTQELKNTYISLPINVKFAAERFNNYRPYVIGGVAPMINLAGKDQANIQLKRYDVMLEVGLGCDFYLPFFKFIPEIKFCYSLTDALDKNHIDALRDANRLAFAKSVSAAHTKMIVLTFYFE